MVIFAALFSLGLYFVVAALMRRFFASYWIPMRWRSCEAHPASGDRVGTATAILVIAISLGAWLLFGGCALASASAGWN